MKRLLAFFVAALCLATASAQQVTEALTIYRNFKPAIIHMTSGRDITNPLTNVFLKNASLLFMKGSQAMEANMETIAGVDFGNDKFVKIDKMLCQLLDTVGSNKLYCAKVIDVEAYNQMLRNNVNITNFSLFDASTSDQLSFTSLDLNPDGDQQLPVICHFYYMYNGKIVKVHEREISRILPKDKKRIYKTIISMDGFQWTDRASLVRLLEAISAESATD